MTPLTSAECRQIVQRKLLEAVGDRRYGKELRATAEAWQVLAEKVEQSEAIEARFFSSPVTRDGPSGTA
jgi:hypothetical protein